MIRRRDGGRIIAISSVSGLTGNRGQVNYSAAKAGLIGATKALAVELATRGITANVVVPGIIETAMTANLPTAEALKMIPMQRIGKPEDVAGIVAFLLGAEAGYITRQTISVNGGMV
jgi:3-oxoacyl-[acyl-carrier protein] reductase